jgi:hypothetical protein
MSADPASGTDRTVYVRLLAEGTNVWRPAPATELSDGVYQLGEPSGFDPRTELWEFPPHTRVRRATKKFADGTEALVAIAIA